MALLQQDRFAVGPKALYDNLHISSCSLQSHVKEEASLDENHIVISTQIQDESSLISTHALVDCGATGFAFIDQEFARGDMARAIIPRRPLTPILDLARRASAILAYRCAADFAMEPSLCFPHGPSLVRVRVDLYITRREAALLLLALWILSRYL